MFKGNHWIKEIELLVQIQQMREQVQENVIISLEERRRKI